MNPDNNQPAPEMNADYLNQISPKPSKRSFIPKSKPVMIGVIAVGFLILITIVGLLASSAGGNIGDTERLAARLQATQDIVSSAKSNVKNHQLRALNSDLDIYLTNTLRDATPILAKHNIQINKLSKTVVSAESDAKILATLEDARLNAIYDRMYASEMAHQLDITIILMQKIFSSTSDSSLKGLLSNAYKTLQPTQKQFEDFNAND
jgi:predicted amino acid-binding ACT domain protein